MKIGNNSPEGEIKRRIRMSNHITFAEFMGIALFWPKGGYYTGESPIGSTGDYYTSPSVHPVFGALIATQVFQIWDLMGRPESFHIIEAGAGNGLLARDILSSVHGLSTDFADAIRYVCLDYRSEQGLEGDVCIGGHGLSVDRVAATMPTQPLIDDVDSISNYSLPFSGVTGCIISNELLDAFPVHQVTVRQGRFQEIFISMIDGRFVQTVGNPSSPNLFDRLRSHGVELKEGQVAEINLGIDRWASEIGSVLDTGYVITIDYGDTAKRLYSFQERPDGSLTTYYKHTQIDDPFQHIGSQDITAQVDFSAVVTSGKNNGLEYLGYTTQRKFLKNLGLDMWSRGLDRAGISVRDVQVNKAGMLDLVRVGGLGDFKVLLQGKNVPPGKLWGFDTDSSATGTVGAFTFNPVPLLSGDHIRILDGLYPRSETEFTLDELWPTDPE